MLNDLHFTCSVQKDGNTIDKSETCNRLRNANTPFSNEKILIVEIKSVAIVKYVTELDSVN